MRLQTARLLVTLIAEHREGLGQIERTHFESAIAYLRDGDIRLSLAGIRLAQLARSLPHAEHAPHTNELADLRFGELEGKAKQLLGDLQERSRR